MSAVVETSADLYQFVPFPPSVADLPESTVADGEFRNDTSEDVATHAEVRLPKGFEVLFHATDVSRARGKFQAKHDELRIEGDIVDFEAAPNAADGVEDFLVVDMISTTVQGAHDGLMQRTEVELCVAAMD